MEVNATKENMQISYSGNKDELKCHVTELDYCFPFPIQVSNDVDRTRAAKRLFQTRAAAAVNARSSIIVKCFILLYQCIYTDVRIAHTQPPSPTHIRVSE